MQIKYGNLDVTHRLLEYKISASFADGYLIGNVPTMQLNLKFDNYDGLLNDLETGEYWEIQETITSQKRYFKVYDQPEKYTKTLSLKLYDDAHELDVAYDTKLSYPATIQDQLNEMETLTGFTFDISNVPEDVLNKEVSWYDNTIVIRNYLGWIAEIAGANLFANGKKSFSFELLSKTVFEETDTLTNYEKNELYRITRVYAENGINPLEKGDETGNTLFLDPNNLYITDDQSIIDRIYSQLNGMEFYSVKSVDMIGIDNLIPGKLINYDDEFNFMIISIENVFKGGEFLYSSIDGTVTTKNEERVIKRISNSTRIRKLQVIQDQEKNRLDIIAQEQEDLNTKVGQLTVSNEEISTSIEEITSKIEGIDATKYSVALENTGTDLYMATDTVTLNVKVYANNEDVTDDQLDIQFQWYKNEVAFKTGKSIVVTADDVDIYANFYCKVTIGDLIKNTQTISVTDNNDIASLGNSFLDTNTSLVQTLDDTTYFPDWSTNNVLITPAVINGAVNVDLSECEIEYKRIVNGEESALVSGETVSDGILTINKNMLTKENPSITYVCYVTYRSSEIKLYISFYLNITAKDGNDGINGTDGVSVVNIINYFALSSSDTQAPASGWITTKPDRSEGQWLWRKDVTKLSDGSEITTPAYVVTGDKGDTGPQGPQGKQGIQGPAGTDGKTTYFHIKYSSVANPTSSSQLTETPSEYIGTYVDFNINDSNDPSDYTWSRFKGIQGDKGDQGIPGTNGADGKTSYLHVKYSDNGTSFTANNGETPGKYMGTYVDFVQADSTTFSDYTWVKIEGPQGVQGPKGADGVQYYTWLKYADSPTSGMSDSPDGKAYIGLAYNKTNPTESSNYSDYTWSKFKGEKGDQGVPGGNGKDGQTLYTWVKYATSASGANMSDDPSGKTYIGLAYNITTATESSNASDYTWSLIKGDKGDTGAAGRGIKGTPVTTYQSGTSATTPPTGTWSSSIPTVAQGSYLWSKTVYTYTDNSTSTVYAVNRNPSDGKNGTNGTDGKDGKGIKSTATSYQASSSGTTVPTGTWTSAVPSTTAGQYLWTRTITTYTDNTTSTAYSVGRNGTNGADASVMSATAPADKNKLWYDTANNLLKYWNGETWEAVNDYAEDLNNMKQQITTEYNSAINQLKNSLTTLVEEISTTSSANSEAISNLSSQIAQNSSSITLATNSIQQITDKITGLTTKEEISQWARYQNGVLELGSSNSPFAVKLSQTELGFYQNGTRIAYLSNQQLNISQAVVLQRIDIGPFRIEYISSTGLVIG